MSAYHVTGPNGAGKSTVGRVLQHRGFRVIETDFEPGLSGWFNNDSGQKAKRPDLLPIQAEWLAAHSWLWDRVKMDELLLTTDSEPTFFVGGAYNEKDFQDDFEKRFALHTNSENLRQRLQSEARGEPGRWIDGSPSLLRALEWNERFVEVSQASGAILINSSVSPGEVADNILTHI